MDAEGSLNLEDYVPPQGGKQIAPKPPKYQKYEMDPSYWQLDLEDPLTEPPANDAMSIAKDDETLAIESPPDEADDDDNPLDIEGEEYVREANKILDH